MIDYPWLEPISQRLAQFTHQQKVPHAILFCGPRGLGEKALLNDFTRLLLCQTPNQKYACGLCRSCHLFQQQHHPDLLSYGEQESVGIEDIREINRFLEQTSHQKGKKVVLLWQAQNLTVASGNALLKTLEEPPGDSVLLLVAASDRILPTIKSRCLVINLPTPSPQVALSWLSCRYPQHEARVLQRSLLFAGNIPFIADDMIKSGMGSQDALCQALLAGDLIAFDSEEIQHFFTEAPLAALYSFYYLLVNFIRFALQCSADFLYNDEQTKRLNRLLQRISLKQIFIYLESVKEAIRALSLPGINKPLLFDALISQWHYLCQGK
ncbi:MAG: DNA polymerase III subunit [Proteobacteria bacterium]|nr:DNA polymerase III subunit [Pseudomonadota bacterium]